MKLITTYRYKYIIVCKLQQYTVSLIGNHEEFQIVSGCNCQGYTVTFQCNAVGNAGWTKWNGSAFNCTNLGNEIIFLHPDGFQSGGTNKTCNGGGIVGQTLPLEDNNIYPSRLNVTLTPYLIGMTVKCVYEDGANHEGIIGVISLYPTTGIFHVMIKKTDALTYCVSV